ANERQNSSEITRLTNRACRTVGLYFACELLFGAVGFCASTLVVTRLVLIIASPYFTKTHGFVYSFFRTEGHLYAADESRVPSWASFIAAFSGFGCGWFVFLLVVAMLNLLVFRSYIARDQWLAPLTTARLEKLLTTLSTAFHK
ncbi:MAG: hypothetical protein ACTHK7_21245, partial [Aureliella sp.]